MNSIGSCPRLVCVRVKEGIQYPSLSSLSPFESFPEYPFGLLGAGRNEVYGLIRHCLSQTCDVERFGTASWNPLGAFVRPGQKVFLLPNLVTDGSGAVLMRQHFARLTHGSVLRAVTDYVLLACGDPSLISFGNASLQGCRYDRVTGLTGAREVARFYKQATGVDIGPHDLRAVVSDWSPGGTLRDRKFRSDVATVAVDLGRDSLLEELYLHQPGPVQFRVGDYSPEETMAHHGPGRHIYLINKRVLDADVIVSIPKLKTHQKVGITCALKGTVGAVARKECLAHHRSGSPCVNGDEFSRGGYVCRLAASFNDRAARGSVGFRDNSMRMIAKLLSKGVALIDGVEGGAWHGNDTAWRMALDISRILRFARPDGTMNRTPVREHLVFVDGIVGGEGNGPLRPDPVQLGAVIFAANPCAADFVSALAMGFDPDRLPLVRNSFRLSSYPLIDIPSAAIRINVNGTLLRPENFGALADFRPPNGWRNHIEVKAVRQHLRPATDFAEVETKCRL